MKRLFVRTVCLLIAVLMLMGHASATEYRRGDRSEDVAVLQQLLIDTGWLFDVADGVFGKNTEQAVRDFEQWAGLPVDGAADAQMIECLMAAWDEMFGDDIGAVAFNECCMQWIDVDGTVRTDFCEAHHAMHVSTYAMLDSGDPEACDRAADIWYEEVDGLYETWIDIAPYEEKGVILGNRATFLASIESQRMTVQQNVAAIVQTLRNQAAWLCNTIWMASNGDPVSDDAQGANAEPIRLNGSAVIDGDRIYYAGEVMGEGEGIYVMDTDGGNRRKINEFDANIAAVSNGNLLIWYYSPERDENNLCILTANNELIPLANDYNGHAIAADGRFYWGACSVAEDGSDIRYLFTDDPDYFNYFWPLEVRDGYLYFLDNCEVGDVLNYSEGVSLPYSASLCRIDLERDSIDFLSGNGTRYMGIENGSAYYARYSYHWYDPAMDTYCEQPVEEGLFRMDLDTLEETRVAGVNDRDDVYEYYLMFSDGVFYGERLDYTGVENCYSIIRVHGNGESLPPISIEGPDSVTAFLVKDGLHYSGKCIYPYAEQGDFTYSYDNIIVNHVYTGKVDVIELTPGETMFYTEIVPTIAVTDEKIYYFTFDQDNGAEYLRSMDLDGSNIKLLVQTDARF